MLLAMAAAIKTGCPDADGELCVVRSDSRKRSFRADEEEPARDALAV